MAAANTANSCANNSNSANKANPSNNDNLGETGESALAFNAETAGLTAPTLLTRETALLLANSANRAKTLHIIWS